MGVKIADKLEQFNNGTYYLVDSSAVEYVDKDGNSQSVKDVLDNGIGEGNTTDLTDIENRITTNETNITGLQEQIDNLDIPDITNLENRVTTNEADITDLQEQIDNLDIPDITDLENRITTNETNITGLQEQIDNLDIPDITNLENASIMYCDVAEINKAKGTNIRLVAGEDNTEKIMNVLAPHEVFAGWFMNEPIYNRFGIDLSMGDRLNFVSIQKYDNKEGAVIAITNKGKVLSRHVRNNILSNWEYDKTDSSEVNTKLSQLETKAALIPVVADNPTDYDLNNYKENGNYSIGDSSKYSNTPIARPALLTVIRSNSYRLQIYTVVNNDDVYFRKSIDWGSSWSSWVLLNGSSGASGNGTNNDVYSTEEQAVGTWINGKTLYRRTIEDNTLRETGTDFIKLFNYSTNMKIVKYEGVVTLNTTTGQATTIHSLPYYDSKYSDTVYVTKTTLDTLRLDSYLTNFKLGGYIVSVYYYKV